MFIQQDTVKAISPATPAFRLNIPVSRPQLDLDRAQEILEQIEEKEDALVEVPIRVVPRVRQPVAPSVDPAMLPYRHIGCRQPVTFPDTVPLTALEHYYFAPLQAAIAPATGQTGTVTPPPDMRETVAGTATVVHPLAANIHPDGYPPVSIMLFPVGMLIFFTWIKYHFGAHLASSIRSFLNYQHACREQEEWKELDRQAALYVNIFCYLVTGVFISFSLPELRILPFQAGYSLSVLLFSFSFALLILGNAIIWKIFGSIFLVRHVAGEYIHHLFLYNRNTGIFVFPVIAVIPFVNEAYLPFLLHVALAVYGGFYLWRIFRYFQIIHAKKVPVFYFILYLCTLEILPFFIMVKACNPLFIMQ